VVWSKLVAPWAACLAFVSCVSPAALSGRPCPCSDGFVCCARTNQCVERPDYDPQACAAVHEQQDGTDAQEASIGEPDVGPGAQDAPVDGEHATPDARDGGPDAYDVEAATPEGEASAPEGSDGTDEVRCEDAALECGSHCENGGGTVRQSNYVSTDSALPFESYLVPGFSIASSSSVGFPTVFSADLTPDASDTYTFLLRTSNGSRLTVDGELVVDRWNRADFPEILAVEKLLVAGHAYRVQVENRGSAGTSIVDLAWQRPQGQPEPIPPCLLKGAQPAPSRCDPKVTSFDCVPLGTAPCGAGTGLVAEYYFLSFDGSKELVHADLHAALRPTWDFVDAPGTSPRFEVRWRGFIQAPASGNYTFFVVAGEYVSLSIEGEETSGNNVEGVHLPGTITVPLIAGKKTPIVMEAPMSGPGAYIQVRWRGPSVPEGDIPICRFLPPDPADAGADGG
jgi:hypothetical protein